MKKLFTLFVCQLIFIASFAQAPQAIPYQGVARDAAGAVLPNRNISLRFKIHDSTAAGTVVYSESQTITTNIIGSFTANIGQGTVLSGTFAGINWNAAAKYIQVEMDINGATAYMDMGTKQMLSVPYALSSPGSNYWIGKGDSLQVSSNFYKLKLGINCIASGLNSTAMGSNTTASGLNSTAMGSYTTASGGASTALGSGTSASGIASTAMGWNTIATGNYSSTSMGYNTIAGDDYATAMGYRTTASGKYSTSMGSQTLASGFHSTSMGYNTIASGIASTATGQSSLASGHGSIAMGSNTTASGDYATAMGVVTTASGLGSTSMGSQTLASGNYSTAMGSYVNTNNYAGTFMIGDADPDNTGVTTGGITNQFVARFKNGYYLMSSNNSVRTGVKLSAGDNAWSAISDSNRKEKLLPVDGESLLKKISGFRLCTWNYKGQDAKTFRHYGPMAQDFHNAFGRDAYGTIGNDSLINQSDFLGVSFNAIQALEKRTQKIANMQAEMDTIKKENAILKEENEIFRKELDEIKSLLKIQASK